MKFSQKMTLYLFYTMVQKKSKMTKNPHQGVLPYVPYENLWLYSKTFFSFCWNWSGHRWRIWPCAMALSCARKVPRGLQENWRHKWRSRIMFFCVQNSRHNEGAIAMRVKLSKLRALHSSQALGRYFDSTREHRPSNEYSYSVWRALLGGGWICLIEVFVTSAEHETTANV